MHTIDDFLKNELNTLMELKDKSVDYDSSIIVSLLHRVAQRMRNKIESEFLSEYGLSWNGFGILYNLWISKSVEMRELSKRMRLAVSTISSIANTLERKDLCQRQTDKQDRRLTHLTLTSHGKKVIEELYPSFNKSETEVLKGLSEGEKKLLIEGLIKIIKNIDWM